MAEFSSLNGYAVKDSVARSIAKGRNQAVAFTDYATMIEALNEYEKDEYKAGQNVYIGVVGVPDLWVYGVEDIRHTFTYVSDEDFVEMLKKNTTVQIGFFKLAMLEGQKVDLTTYDQHLAKHDEDIAELNNDVVGINNSLGSINVYVGSDKKLHFVDKDGADSVLPFSSLDFKDSNVYFYDTTKLDRGSTTYSDTLTIANAGKYLISLTVYGDKNFSKINSVKSNNVSYPFYKHTALVETTSSNQKVTFSISCSSSGLGYYYYMGTQYCYVKID